MRRRTFIGATAATWAWPLPARAQSKRVPIVAFIGFSSAEGDRPFLDALRKGLRDAGLIEGGNVRVESRHAGGDFSQADAIIMEMVALKADVLIAPGPAAARAARRVTSIPIVAVQLPPVQSDPELYDSLARPGGTVTGFSSMGEGLSAKRIELLKELLPGVKVLGILHNGTDPTFSEWGVATERDARAQGLAISRRALSSTSAHELRQQFAALQADGATALIVIRDFLTTTIRNEIVQAAATARIAVVAEHRDFTDVGALLSYGPDILDLFRRAGSYVDKILKGEKAGDLPIQLPTKFELVVNGRTAATLGLMIPPSILIRADEVIE
jgi:putative tryptophan/tyrosine transport system substrate-binding protein